MTFDENFNISWDDNDIIQVQEDEWVAAILGSEEEVIEDILSYV